jgi:hypothetical protein
MKPRNAYCSFCRKSYKDVGPLVEGPDRVYICGECVSLCQDIIDQEKPRRRAADPQEIRAALDRLTPGQEQAKTVLSEAAFGREEGKRRVLLTGQAQSVAMLLAKAVAFALDAPFAAGDASGLTKVWPGNLFYDLLEAADLDLESTQRGVVFVGGLDRSEAQETLYQLWQKGITNPLGNMTLDTRGLLFVCGASFAGPDEAVARLARHPEQPVSTESLRAVGARPEWIAALSAVACVSAFAEETLARMVNWVDFRREQQSSSEQGAAPDAGAEGHGEVYICGVCVKQPQVLAPLMIESMKILQLPITALEERIQQELQENPVLELSDTCTEDAAPGEEVNEFQDHKPDMVVQRTGEGDYAVRLTDGWTTKISISRHHLELYRENADPKAKEYLERKIQAAQWLLESIEQRRHTLEKVTKAIIKHQQAFLDKGPEFIVPLKMQQIAEQVGVHVTTVSRAVDDKWVQTPPGILPLERFFGGGTQTLTGEEVAWEKITPKLLDLVDKEDKSSPLSDEDLVTKLGEAGYPVARRTVTKYRKMLNIPSSRQRKD